MIYGIAKWHENKDLQANPPSSKGVKNLGTTLSSLWCTEQYSKLTVGCWSREISWLVGIKYTYLD